MKTAYIAGTLGNGGAERQLYYALRTMKQADRESRVYCLTKNEFWEQPIIELGVPVIYFGNNKSRLVRNFRLIKELNDFRPDVIESRHFYTNIYVAVAARSLGVVSIGAVRNDIVNEMKAVGSFYGQLCLRLPDFIAANSNNAIRNAVSMGISNDKFIIRRNIVDTKYFSPPLNKSTNIVTIVAIGRFVEQKRFDRFLSIIHKLKNISETKFRAILAGDGPLKSKLIDITHQYKLSDTVEFVGTFEDIREIYNKSDILLSTSEWEGMPNVVMEAMSCAMPVVAFEAGDISEIIRDGESGYIVAQHDEDRAVTILDKLISTPQHRSDIGNRAREIILVRYSKYEI